MGRDAGLKIALVAPSLDILGGQGVQADRLAAQLRGEGYQVELIPINPRFPNGLSPLRRLPYVRTVVNEALYSASLRRLRNCEVVHIFTASYWSFLLTAAPAITAARLYGKRIVLNYHSGEADDHLSNWGPLVHPWLRAAGQLVVPSEYLRSVFARHGYQATVVQNSLELTSFSFRERLPLRPRLLSTRNLESHYAVDDVIEAFALLRRSRPDATLLVAGSGSQEARLRELARARGLTSGAGELKFLGRVEPQAVPSLYEESDIYVNGSLIDNQPLSLIEAFAAGTPVVSTPTGDIAAMIESGKTGLLVPQRDPRALASAVGKLLDDPESAARMAQGARRNALQYTWPNVKQGWSRVYAGGAP